MSQNFLPRLFDPEEPDDRPKPSWTLTRLARDRYVPRLERKGTKLSTIKHLWEALAKWREVSAAQGEPSIAHCERTAGGQELADAFAAHLDLGYRRGRLGKTRPYSEFTRDRMFTLISRLFRFARKRGLIKQIPRLPQLHPEMDEEKPPYPIADARAIWLACLLMTWPEERKRKKNPPRGALPPAPIWWRAFVAIAYYTGLRAGDILALKWENFRPDDGQRAPRLVGMRAKKTERTKNKLKKLLHPDAVAAIEALLAALGPVEPGDLMFPRPFDMRLFAKQHARLCRLAGLPAARVQSPQAWRRTHAVERERTGEDARREDLRAALDHSSAAVTMAHYAQLPTTLRLMARLVVEPNDSARNTG